MATSNNNSGKLALVTGGTRGIGLGIAKCLAASGFDVVITGRRDKADVADSLLDVAQSFITPTQRVEYQQADVSSATERHSMLDAIDGAFGGVDVLVNNAGIAPRVRADILEATEESFDDLIGTNLKGPYFLTQAVAKRMISRQEKEREHRSIINVSSVSATVASVNRGDYCISKAGIAMATKLWAARLTQFGIGVYEVQPGVIATDMTAGVKGKYDALIEGELLLDKRWGTPNDVGVAVAMLATGQLPYAPGAVLVLDGGLTLPRL
ncbi:3-ketoacyl-ACP reductase [Terriglobus roseus]|uniref:NAD(P)-dependent dehydrogenase, short-chain alcohol dehydrogenase family n=1 Tax=Terriglobus roseus TaxID=392734 RepID=A0A1H4JS14_9BACT|nr:3-ketoacyl-ACP reductase [Terriglobus roseus]SEB49053.1 NAD(P)-dependent dehydrogenase, short-chain alcohol dehydrogenase family [Terriglobus roseus]